VPSIDPNLFQRLKDKLGVGAAALYGKIQSAANKYGLERPEAALALARSKTEYQQIFFSGSTGDGADPKHLGARIGTTLVLHT